jgi:hypothetical protein
MISALLSLHLAMHFTATADAAHHQVRFHSSLCYDALRSGCSSHAQE